MDLLTIFFNSYRDRSRKIYVYYSHFFPFRQYYITIRQILPVGLFSLSRGMNSECILMSYFFDCGSFLMLIFEIFCCAFSTILLDSARKINHIISCAPPTHGHYTYVVTTCKKDAVESVYVKRVTVKSSVCETWKTWSRSLLIAATFTYLHVF